MDEESDISDTPDIPADAGAVSLQLLPVKSRLLYEKEYDAFDSWCFPKKISKVSESVLRANLREKSEIMEWSLP
ncbi:hypothetical protein JTB14_031407 [Gonioctena quinquepunctata]|nr:hypothetical protein JTB14_031407 [Gonioctena quinquepunctata]